MNNIVVFSIVAAIIFVAIFALGSTGAISVPSYVMSQSSPSDAPPQILIGTPTEQSAASGGIIAPSAIPSLPTNMELPSGSSGGAGAASGNTATSSHALPGATLGQADASRAFADSASISNVNTVAGIFSAKPAAEETATKSGSGGGIIAAISDAINGVAKYCTGGKYCDGSVAPDGEAGAVICGENNMKSVCKLVDDKLVWVPTSDQCDVTMAGACQPQCHAGVFCDGSIVPPSPSGTMICGPNAMQFRCDTSSGSGRWINMGKICEPGMQGYCAPGCTGIKYCDGSTIPPINSTVGSIVCSGGNQQFQCQMYGGSPQWIRLNQACSSEMSGRCIAGDTTTCVNGRYCDGTPVTGNAAELGSTICGYNNTKYQCKSVNGVPTWANLSAACDPGMANMCEVSGSNLTCPGGRYCDGGAISGDAAKVGSVVCGASNVKYQCQLMAGVPKWSNTGLACDAGMPGRCPVDTSVAPYCVSGRYCDGTLVAPADATENAYVCGSYGTTKNAKYQCRRSGNTLAWAYTGQPCSPGMPHSCATFVGKPSYIPKNQYFGETLSPNYVPTGYVNEALTPTYIPRNKYFGETMSRSYVPTGYVNEALSPNYVPTGYINEALSPNYVPTGYINEALSPNYIPKNQYFGETLSPNYVPTGYVNEALTPTYIPRNKYFGETLAQNDNNASILSTVKDKVAGLLGY